MVRLAPPQEDAVVPAHDELNATEQSETSEPVGGSPAPRQENPDRQTCPIPAETQNPEPTDREERPGPPPVSDREDAPEEKGGAGGDSDPASRPLRPRGYECRYCPFSTQNLSGFEEHVDSSHPAVILNPAYLCAVCNFSADKFDSLAEHNGRQHPGETGFRFKRARRGDRTVLEQTIEGRGGGRGDRTALEQTIEGRGEGPPTAERTPDSLQALYRGSALKGRRDGPIQKNRMATAVNGAVTVAAPAVLHVAPMLQRPPNFSSVPKIAVPLNTAKYNPSLDGSAALIASFSRFPYPTHAELSWLTAASRHPEQQIRVWFTTQRLKQGITWSPEEVEEARKKMFDGSTPPAHPTFTAPPTSRQTFVHAAVGRADGSGAVADANSGLAIGSAPSLKRCLPTYPTAAAFGPESKRPVMAVAPHSGDAKDRGLMAPPPPPPPKDRLPMAPPPAPVAVPPVPGEMKRLPAAVPLMPPPSEMVSSLGNPKTKPAVSPPSFVFPEFLTRPLVIPPPIFAPPFKNPLLFPLNSPSASNEKLPSPPPAAGPHARRPTIIRSIRAPAKAPTQMPGFLYDGRLKEQRAGEGKASCPRGGAALAPLAEANGASRSDKRSRGQTPLGHNNGVRYFDGPPVALKSAVLTQFPLLERMKGKSAEQLKVLEENFLRNGFPTLGGVDDLAGATRLSRQEIDSWFVERRALRDDLERALLNSMGTRRTGGAGITAVAKKRRQQHQTGPLNGTRGPGGAVGRLQSPAPPPSAPPIGVSSPASFSAPPDGRAPALLLDEFARTRWPSPEERGGPARRFTDSRLQGGGLEPEKLFHNGGQGPPKGSAPGFLQRCQEGALANRKLLEAELSRLLQRRQREELHDRPAGR